MTAFIGIGALGGYLIVILVALVYRRSDGQGIARIGGLTDDAVGKSIVGFQGLVVPLVVFDGEFTGGTFGSRNDMVAFLVLSITLVERYDGFIGRNWYFLCN